MRRADRRQKRQDEEEAKDQVKSVPTSGYVSMHSKDDAPSPPTKLGQAREKLLRTGSLFASTMTRAAKELKEKAKKAAGRSPTEKVDQRACSGGGRVAASSYVQRAHLQYDTLSTEAVTGRLQAHNTLRGDGGFWALKARYVAATKAVPGQLRAARDAEDHASRLADTLAQANERFEALKTQEHLLRALVEEARRLTVEKPANGLLASFPRGAAPPPAALGSPASSRSPASVGSPAASHKSADAPARRRPPTRRRARRRRPRRPPSLPPSLQPRRSRHRHRKPATRPRTPPSRLRPRSGARRRSQRNRYHLLRRSPPRRGLCRRGWRRRSPPRRRHQPRNGRRRTRSRPTRRTRPRSRMMMMKIVIYDRGRRREGTDRRRHLLSCENPGQHPRLVEARPPQKRIGQAVDGGAGRQVVQRDRDLGPDPPRADEPVEHPRGPRRGARRLRRRHRREAAVPQSSHAPSYRNRRLALGHGRRRRRRLREEEFERPRLDLAARRRGQQRGDLARRGVVVRRLRQSFPLVAAPVRREGSEERRAELGRDLLHAATGQRREGRVEVDGAALAPVERVAGLADGLAEGPY